MKRPFFYIALSLAVGVAAILGLEAYKAEKETTATTGKVMIGGPFTLVDHNGKTVKAADFKGRYKLMFFGYTFCPDVCPTALQTVSEALDILEKDAERVVPIFISVDPERDTVEVLKDYVSNFHPKIIGLTGTPEQIASVSKRYKVMFSKVTDEKSDPESYLMNHTAAIFLMGPDGAFLTLFGHQNSPADIAKIIRKYF